MGYMPFCARLSASTLISSRMHSARPGADNAGVNVAAIKSANPAMRRQSLAILKRSIHVRFPHALETLLVLLEKIRGEFERYSVHNPPKLIWLENKFQAKLQSSASARAVDGETLRKYLAENSRVATV